MRWIVLLALLAQTDRPLTGEWVGPLELTVYSPSKARIAIPTDVQLTETDGKMAGTWRSRPPNTLSGTISGTRAKLDVVFYADAETEAERCQAHVILSGRLTSANIYQLTAEKMIPDERPRKLCGQWPTDLVWLLQRAH